MLVVDAVLVLGIAGLVTFGLIRLGKRKTERNQAEVEIARAEQRILLEREATKRKQLELIEKAIERGDREALAALSKIDEDVT